MRSIDSKVAIILIASLIVIGLSSMSILLESNAVNSDIGNIPRNEFSLRSTNSHYLTETNNAPVATGIPDDAMLEGGTYYLFIGDAFADADDPISSLTFSWIGPDCFYVSFDSGALEFTVIHDGAGFGVYTIEITATDDDGESVSDSFTISVSLSPGSDLDSDFDGWSDYNELFVIFTDPNDPGPFLIIGDAQLLAMDAYHGWDGSGLYGDPIIIEGYDIDLNGADASCIKIQNIFDTYFIIRDCTLTGTSVPEGGLEIPFDDAYGGIWLSNVQYAEVTNNYCFGNCYGIRVDYSHAVTITDNHCYSNDWEGIAVLLDSTECVVTDNYCFDNVGLLGNGIGVGVGAYHNQIVHNFVYDNSGDEAAGIHIFLGYDNTIVDNDCYGNRWGIAVRGTSSDNDILENQCWNNYMGIYIQNSDSNIIADNDCFLNSFEGIAVNGDSSGNIVTDNECYDNVFNGIGIGAWATGNTVEHNIAYNNGEAGIHFWLGFDTIVRENECYGNYWGIALRGESSGNDIIENTVTSNAVGIYLFEVLSNTIYHNSIIDNTIQALEEDPIGDNFWYSPTLLEGNIWSDYIGVDWDRDGIGDTDIPWPGEGYDLYPLVTDDFDNDGLSYYAEIVIGTDPYNDDSDGDYFKDDDEWRYFFSDPTVPETPSEVSVIIDSSLEDLVDEGILEQKDTNPLLKKLDAARDLMDRGRLFQASQKLGDFISQINSMINKGKLTEEEGNALIALAQALIDVILTM